MSNGKGMAHLLATIIVVLLFVVSVASLIGGVFMHTSDSVSTKVISLALASILGWLSYKMVNCEFVCN